MARRKRGGYHYDHGFAPYISVGDRKSIAEDAVEELRESNPDIQPVVITGRTIARSWWGKSWNKNIERYADYAFRLDRGRSYVRCGNVLDLKILPGEIMAMVAGSSDFNYTVKIHIAPLHPDLLQSIIAQTQQQLHSLTELLEGSFPKALQDLFFMENDGLFPNPGEIKFDCNCLDWADMCKHVAATLYGVGARLDDDPSLFFTLRHIDQQQLVRSAISTHTDALLARAEAPPTSRRRRITDKDVGSIFGVTMQQDPDHQS